MDTVCHGFFVATKGFLRGMVPNDILAILAVAVTLGVVVASEGARDPSASAMRPVLLWSVCACMLCKKRTRPASPPRAILVLYLKILANPVTERLRSSVWPGLSPKG